jgi:hypothetical protein
MSVKPTAPTTETPGGPLSANSEEARVISIDKDSDMESRTTSGPKKYSLRHGQPPATLRNPGSEDDHWGDKSQHLPGSQLSIGYNRYGSLVNFNPISNIIRRVPFNKQYRGHLRPRPAHCSF